VLRGQTLDFRVSPLESELPRARTGAETILSEADMQRGYDDGYQAGVAEGLAAGQAAAAAECAAALARLEAAGQMLAEAAADLRRRQALELVGLEDSLARAAIDLAAAVVGREVEVSASPGADALARALALVPAGSAAVARLHPADAALLEDVSGVTVIPDPAVEPGGCILEVGDSRIDAQLGPALDRDRAALLP
jgi:flagellar assembly protein FliH